MENNKILNDEKNLSINNISMARKQKILLLINEFQKANPKKKVKYNNTYTKAFQEFNKQQLILGKTDIVAFSDNKLFDNVSNRFINKNVYLTQKDKPRKKYSNENLFSFNGDVFNSVEKYTAPIATRLKNAELKNDRVKIKIDFTKMNNNLDNLLKLINPSSRYIIKTELQGVKKYWTLSSETIADLRKLIKEGNVMIEGADIDSKTSILYSWTLREPFVLSRIKTREKKKNKGKKKGKQSKSEGGFFNMNHILSKVDLSRYGVFTPEQELEDDDKYNNNCICQALENYGIDITPIKHIVKNRVIPHKDLEKVANTLGIYISLKYLTDEKKKNHYGDKTKEEIKIANINKHYFLIEKTNYTRYCIEHYDEIEHIEEFNRIENKTKDGKYKKGKRFIDSYNVIKILFNNKDKYLVDIKFHNNLYKSIYHNEIEEFGNLEYDEDINSKENPEAKMDKELPDNAFKTLYYDFETTTQRNDGEIVNHKPYMVYCNELTNGWWGEDCGRNFLNYLCNLYGTNKNSTETKTINYKCKKTGENKEMKVKLIDQVFKHRHQLRLVAHNGGYDFRFIIKYLYKLNTIEKMNGLMNGNALCFNGSKVLSINLRDSLKMINMPLRKFKSAFKLEVQKEILPYNLYTEENVEKRYLPIDYCLSFIKRSEKDEYLENCKNWNCINDNMIDILEYSGRYCYMDCKTLQKGCETFASLVKTATGQKTSDYISLASMANDYLLHKKCYDDVKMLSGVPRHFIQKCVVGGRCMTAQNKKWIKKNCNISDFDAVSLYPSAMNRMDGFLQGPPKVIENFEPNLYDGYFIQIVITKIKKHYNFPLASVFEKNKSRNFTNDLIGKSIFIDKTSLEDLVHFQGVEYEFIKGYYYDEGRNANIKNTMKHLFNQRLKYKKEKNPIQLVFKELMNSSYGKSFMKPIDCDLEYINKDKIEEYIEYNFNHIKEMVLMCDDRTYRIKKIKTIDEHFNNVPCGVEILSMSKRIMNEVMTLAEDNKLPIYITDTDSMHINTECVEILAEKFKEKYGKDLIGKYMGQFHTDFDLDGSIGDIIATDCVFLGKKCYVDKLQSLDKDGNIINGWHIRMKGVPNDCILHKADTEYNGDLIQLYEDLYNGKKLSFNLLACRPKFEYKKNMTIASKSEFNRSVKFNQDIGEIIYC